MAWTTDEAATCALKRVQPATAGVAENELGLWFLLKLKIIDIRKCTFKGKQNMASSRANCTSDSA